jgi:hypothetical protein
VTALLPISTAGPDIPGGILAVQVIILKIRKNV